MTPKTLFFLLLFIPFFTQITFAGPPFNTDDPEPVDYLHWEFYVSSMMAFQSNQTNLTLPHFEINYGAIQNLQIHLLAPLGYNHTTSGSKYGYSNTEIGVKYRFVQETDNTPQIGVFPLVEAPTGDKSKGLSNGQYQFYLPVWFQKSWGNLTTYCGAGYWINPGTGNKNWIYSGWEVQYDFSKFITLGGEVYYHTQDSQDTKSEAGFNIGGYLNPDETNHVLFSIGSTIGGSKTITGYLGYQMTI